MKIKVDSEYLLFGMDNIASTCMKNNIYHFIGLIKPINNRVVKVYAGLITVRREGKVKYNIEDNDRQIHSTTIHNTNYMPEAPSFLLLLQQWYQQAADIHPKYDGKWCVTKAKQCIV